MTTKLVTRLRSLWNDEPWWEAFIAKQNSDMLERMAEAPQPIDPLHRAHEALFKAERELLHALRIHAGADINVKEARAAQRTERDGRIAANNMMEAAVAFRKSEGQVRAMEEKVMACHVNIARTLAARAMEPSAQ